MDVVLRIVRRLSALRRLLVTVCGLVICLNLGFMSGASAHSAGNSPSSNYVSTVKNVQPSTKSFSIKTIEAGSRLELRWLSGPVLEVADYDGFPYLRVGPDGVDENQQSFAVYLNKDRRGSTSIPEGLKPEGPPQWKRVSAEPVARWHDHRVHWMGKVRPDNVVAQPDKRQLVQNFTVEVKQRDQTHMVSGVLEWVPGPSPVPYLLIAVVLAGALGAIGVWAGFDDRRRRFARMIAAVACIVLAAFDALHLAGIAFGTAGSTSDAIGRAVSLGFVSIVAWLLLVVGAILLLRNRVDAYYLVILGAGLTAIIGGFADVGVLSRSSTPFAFELWLLRLSVAATLGLGLGLVVAGVLLTSQRPSVTAKDAPSDLPPVDPATPDYSEPEIAIATSTSTNGERTGQNNVCLGTFLEGRVVD